MTPDASKSRAELLAELEQLRGLLDQIPAMVWTTDEDFCLVSWTGGGLKSLGYGSSEGLGMDVYEFFDSHDPDLPPIQAHHRAIRGESVSYEFARRGIWAQAHVEPLYGEEGEIRGVIGVAIDITDRKRAEHERERLLEELERTLQEARTLAERLVICADCRRIRTADDAWEPPETYFESRGLMVFSHGLCPDCLRAEHPGARTRGRRR